jgi:hypothetical protein
MMPVAESLDARSRQDDKRRSHSGLCFAAVISTHRTYKHRCNRTYKTAIASIMASPTGTTAARLKIVLQRGQALALSEISVRMNAEAPAQLATIGSLKRPTARRGDILFRVGPQNADSDPRGEP